MATNALTKQVASKKARGIKWEAKDQVEAICLPFFTSVSLAAVIVKSVFDEQKFYIG